MKALHILKVVLKDTTMPSEKEYINEAIKELEELQNKSGDYIVIYYSTAINNWNTVARNRPLWDNNVRYKLIHKKHKDILDAYLADNSVEIEWFNVDGFYKCKCFIESYNENFNYRLKQQYPIFKRNENGEVFKITNDKLYSIVLSKNSENIGEVIYYCNSLLNSYETIPFDEERGLYHLQPVWCWETSCDIGKNIRLYNTLDKKCIAPMSTTVITSHYDNIEPISAEQLKVMPFVWKMYQQVLKDKQ